MVYKISSNSLSNNAITTDKINDDAVTSEKIEDSFLQGVIPIGGIIMFTGSTAPDGYVFCDDSEEAIAASAPDLRDKFVVGFTPFSNSTSYPNLQLGASGGSPNAVLVAHNHTYTNRTNASNQNNVTGGPSPIQDGALPDQSTSTTGIDATGTSDTNQTGTNANLPPYYALAFIMRIS